MYLWSLAACISCSRSATPSASIPFWFRRGTWFGQRPAERGSSVARASVKKWTLYVDESGNFANSEDDVAIAGLLVSDELPGLTSNEVKRSLEAALPGFPWPWHAGLLNSASWVALV